MARLAQLARKLRDARLLFSARFLNLLFPESVLDTAAALRAAKRKGSDEAVQQSRHLIGPNSALRGRHGGERCFVLCNGPSVNNQDLSRLSGETVFSVASGYHHPLFGTFRPRYHCVPQVGTSRLTESEVTAWFREIETSVGPAELFLSTIDEPLVRRHGLFQNHNVHYLFFNGSFDHWQQQDIIDISRDIPGVQSVPIMCLMVAMYMGFREIFLLGTDHDHFLTGSYTYFYKPTLLQGKDPSTGPDGRLISPRYEQFHELAALWRQYRAMRNIAASNGIGVFNATHGGALDEFPRVTLEQALERKPSVRVHT